MRACAQAQDSIAQSRPEAAQARGRALLNLRMQDAEGGLLGRTLLTLVSNKVCILLVLPNSLVVPSKILTLLSCTPCYVSSGFHASGDACWVSAAT